LYYALNKFSLGVVYDVMCLCKEVGGVDRAGGGLDGGNKGCIVEVEGGSVELEVVFVSCEPVGLHVYGVSDERVGVDGELGF
jgi:hypothetical protein